MHSPSHAGHADIFPAHFDYPSTAHLISEANLSTLKPRSIRTRFIISRSSPQVNCPPFLSEANITEMSRSGLVSIQSHTKSHPSLTALGRAALAAEMAESKAVIDGVIHQNGDPPARHRRVGD